MTPRVLRMARVSLHATVLLEEGDSAADLTPEDVRDILLTVLDRRSVPELGSAGSFGTPDRTWAGVYEVEKSEILATSLPPRKDETTACRSDAIENGRALERRRDLPAGIPLTFPDLDVRAGGEVRR